MKVTKILETRLDIIDINSIFCSDYEKNIMSMLKNKYNNRCFKSIYILDVNRIVARSNLHCKNKVLDGSTYIDVSFEISGIVYEKGDIIHNCKIIQINNNGTMHAKSKYASIHIKNIDGLVVFKEMEEVPVIVNMTRYNIFEDEISVSAIPFIPILKKSTVFKITDALVNDESTFDLFDFNQLNKYLDMVQTESKNNKIVFKFFTELLHPYKVVKDFNLGKKTKIDLTTLLELKNDNLLYTPESKLNASECFILNDTDLKKLEKIYPDTSIININHKEYIYHTLNNYSKNLECLLEFMQIYNTEEKIKQNTKFWSLYSVFKKT